MVTDLTPWELNAGACPDDLARNGPELRGIEILRPRRSWSVLLRGIVIVTPVGPIATFLRSMAQSSERRNAPPAKPSSRIIASLISFAEWPNEAVIASKSAAVSAATCR